MKDMQLPGLDQTRVRESFRRGLETYHQNASAQAGIAARLAQLLREHGTPHRFGAAFEFGCGTGHLTAELMQGFGIGQLTLNDLVAEAGPRLRALTAHRAEATHFAFGPVETVPLPRELDLVASASTVQWIADVPALMMRLAARLRPGGWLAVSGFGRAQFHELAALGPAAAAPSYADAAEWLAMLPADMEIVAVEQRPAVMEFASALSLLKHLRLTGVNGHARQSWSRGRLRAFEAEYRARFGRDGRLPLTYDPVWVIARKRG
ncbi:methyltransferase domain-containing protein [Roseobacteraceae bacterium NS-SX3]